MLMCTYNYVNLYNQFWCNYEDSVHLALNPEYNGLVITHTVTSVRQYDVITTIFLLVELVTMLKLNIHVHVHVHGAVNMTL
jgi:hypothetical protein